MPGPNDGVLPPVGSNEREAYDRKLRARNLSKQNRNSMYNADGSYDYGRIGGYTPSGSVDYGTALRNGQTQRQKEYDDREAFINSPVPQLVNMVVQADGGDGFQQGPRPVIPPAGQQSSSPAPTVAGNAPQLSDPRIERLRNKSGNSRPQMQNSNAGIAQRSNRRYGTQEAHDNFNDMVARMTAGVNRLNARDDVRKNKAGQDVANPRTLDPNRNAPAPAPGTVAQGQIKA